MASKAGLSGEYCHAATAGRVLVVPDFAGDFFEVEALFL
jgi:hypothetical protein